MVLRLDFASELPYRQRLGPTPRVTDSVGLCGVQELASSSNKFPDVVGDAGPGTTL